MPSKLSVDERCKSLRWKEESLHPGPSSTTLCKSGTSTASSKIEVEVAEAESQSPP